MGLRVSGKIIDIAAVAGEASAEVRRAPFPARTTGEGAVNI
jgi:hypothetical protein